MAPNEIAWLREQVRQEVEQLMAPLRRELDTMDNWANGVFAALLDLLLPLLKSQPELARALEVLWSRAADEYAELERHPDRAADSDVPPELLEARKLLYWTLSQLGHWPGRRRRPRRRPVS